MISLNPLLLAGLSAVGIPILIHLLNRRRFRKMPWAAMRYLKASIERNQRRMKLEDWILLAMRCALLALLALTLARPAFRSFSSSFLPASGAMVVILDRSASMTATDGDRSHFDQARDAALEALESVPRGSTAAILPVPADPNETQFLVPTAAKADWNAILDAVLPTAAPADLVTAITRALEHLQSQSVMRRELVIISDRWQYTWRDVDVISASLDQAGRDVKVHVVLIGKQQRPARQLGISRIAVGPDLVLTKQASRLDITVANYGTEDASQVPVRVLFDDQATGDAILLAAVPAGEAATAHTYLELPTSGYHAIRAELAEDALPADNKRTTIVRAVEQVRLLVVDGDPGLRPADSETFFLRYALGAGRLSAVAVDVVSAQELSRQPLTDYVAVFLANVADLPPGTVEQLDRFVRDGGGLIVFPGDRVNPGFYNRELATKLGLLPAKLGGRWKQDTADNDPGKHLEAGGDSYQVVQSWSDPASNPFAAASFREGFILVSSNDSAGEATSVVLRFADQSPALVERRVERGWVYLFASTADTAWNDLPTTAAFVPLLAHLTGRIVRGADDELHVEAGGIFRWPLPTSSAEKPAVIYPLDAAHAPGVQQSVDKTAAGAELVYANTLTSGAYEASVAEPRLRLLFAVQPAVSESESATLTSAQLTILQTSARVVDWSAGLQLRTVLASERVGAELWQLLLVGVLITAVVESSLAQWFSRSK